MATVRSVDFLPEIFQTNANKQFLAATLDQLIQEPKFKKTQGFIGRTVGPGVNPNDKYVVGLDKVRNDYQLEPGVISLTPGDNTKIKDSITYPGITDALALQGAATAQTDRLYTSEYYTWDPFVNFDTLVNFSQYYWLPNGPDVVNVSATGVPTSENFAVTRDNGVYEFSNIAGNNPTIDLVRGGSYTFQVAQQNVETVNFRVTRSGVTSYQIDYLTNPVLTLIRGNTYVFTLNQIAEFPFWIKTAATTGTGDAYSAGVSRNGATAGLVTFVVPQEAPDTLYYSCQTQSLMNGQINIINGTPGTGSRFWIQTSPGISGQNPITPNISSRQVYGVVDNGIDLGTVTFNVPVKNAQDFYYNLTSIGTVDLITDLQFDQINGARLDQFIATYGGIDGITNLNTRTLVFTNQIPGDDGGWLSQEPFDPLDNNITQQGAAGSYDSLPFAYTVQVPPDQYYSVWQISYVLRGGATYLQLSNIRAIEPLEKFTVSFGTQYSSTQWYKLQNGYLSEIPVLTAQQDILYYQDSSDPEIFGRIRLLEQTGASTLYIDDILGKTVYTSPGGVVFTNGLKVRFPGDVFPTSYATDSLTLQCTSTAASLNIITCSSTAGLIVGQQCIFTGTPFGGVAAGVVYYIHTVFSNTQFIVSTTKGGPAVTLTSANGSMIAIASQAPEYYVSGVGTSIELLPVSNFITPESELTENTLLGTIDYLTVDRASKDLNAWTRSNRWFHIDVLNTTGIYNKTPVVLDNAYRAKRSILQFRAGIRLFDMGTDGKQPVNIVDFAETDALSNVEGSVSYEVNGYTVVDGSRVIFAADTDPQVRNKIYVVNFITPDTVPPLIAQPIINLVEAVDGEVLIDQNTVCLSGNQVGITYWYDGIEWRQAQLKINVQQAPLFNVYDNAGVSLGNRVKYPSSTFIGTKLFSYATGNGIVDPVLKFKLRYLTLGTVGDIVFDNNLYADTFVYVIDNVSTIKSISSGYVYEYANRLVYQRLLGWQTAATSLLSRQQFKFVYNSAPLVLDVAALPDAVTTVPAIKIFVGSVFQDPGTYSVVTTSNTTTITFSKIHLPGDVIEVAVLSNQVSATAFYQVPLNLEKNPLNNNSNYFTLGTVRQHYESICENLTTFTGTINGVNNTRDLTNLVPYGQIILQQSSPLTLAGYFLRSNQYNIFASLEYNSREYQKYKNQLLEAITRQTIQEQTAGQILDTVLAEISLGRTSQNPFYWSDMLPAGEVYDTTTYTVSYTTGDVFDTIQVYNYTSANYQGMNVYLNGRLLERDFEYSVAVDGPRITILQPLYNNLVIGDQIVIQEYTETYGIFAPNTPTKLGLYPVWRPKIITVRTTTGDQLVIQGHDGSQTPVFGDIRDEVLLEFEARIYNNLKLDGNPVPLDIADVLPGQFRSTGYSFAEINNMLATSLLTYVGWNKLDYNSQTYDQTNAFSWNYSAAQNKLNNQNLLGAWRGNYRYFYDTQQPELTPWEMIGFTVKPVWWDITYGAGPYTRNNLNLWDDLELGLVQDPAGPYIIAKYARPGLTSVLPTGTEGELLAPINTVAGIFDEQQFRKSWIPGDGGPVEAAWWNSSDYPFAVMRLLALTRPAQFFALFADRDLYRYQTEFGQYLYQDRYRLNANQIQVYGNGASKASYIDWIVDYNRVLGKDSTQDLMDDLDNLDVRLCYRMASFSDKQYIKLYTEKSSPNSTNTTLLIPDESYDLLVYKNQPFDSSSYSSVVIQVVAGGYAVFGYSTARPYFNIVNSSLGGTLRTFTVADKTIQVPNVYTQVTTQVPYGFVFTTESAVADFLLCYGKLLEKQGFEFVNQDNGYIMDWSQMVQEFMYWSTQGWGQGSLINLNPLAQTLTVVRKQAVVDTIKTQTVEHVLLNQNRQDFPVRNLNIVRVGNTFSIEPLSAESLSFINLQYTSFESMIVLNNASLFGDLIYDPTTGARQSRLNLTAFTTTNWNGSVDAPGFILNQDNISAWTGLKTYAKGELVTYKGAYWSAAAIVQPGTKFNYNNWNQSDYTYIQRGLLPNLANKANQLTNSYNINSANLEADNDLLSYGLIGYRPRQYMAALNLDDVSQLNIYREFIGSKGTKLSVDLFSNADFGKEVADYAVYENWAVQRSIYGANANRKFIDLRLDQADLTSNPAVVQIVVPQQASTADQRITLSNVWSSSFPLTTTQIFPTTTTMPTDSALPTAGYANTNDVDITVFNLNNPASLSANLNRIIVGTSIWVAKVNDYDWNIYRAQAVPGQIQHVCDNLNGTSIVKFSGQHELLAGNRLIIRFFDSEIDGVYTILSVPSLTDVTVAFSFDGQRTVANGIGIGFTLKTMRVAQASDVLTLPYAQQILPGAKVWVDDNGQGLWEVLQKQNPFTARTATSPVLRDASEQYGASVAQATDRTALFVGSPRYGFGTGVQIGAIYLYVKDYADQYTPISPIFGQDTVLTPATVGLRGYGNAVDAGNQTWAVGGASSSLGPNGENNNGYAAILYRTNTPSINSSPWIHTQLLTLPGTTTSTTPGAGEFGYSVAMSLDERWLYVGAPGLDTVYAYGQVAPQSQNVTYLATGVSNTATLTGVIQINNANQITVTQNGRILALTTDYTVNGGFTTVTFVVTPAAGDKIVIQRNTARGFVSSGTSTYDLGTYLYTVNNIDSFSVTVDGILQRLSIDYTYSAGNLVFAVAPVSGASIAVLAQTYYQLASSITANDGSSGDRFGNSVQCTTDGRQVIIGALNNTVGDLIQAGSVYVFDRNVQKFIVSNAAQITYTVLGTVTAPVSVLLNNVFLVNVTDGISGAPGTFSVSGLNITINSTLAVGDVIEIETNQFVQQQQVTQNTVAEFTNFGQSLDLCPYNCSLYVGAPQDSNVVWKGGVVQRSVNQARTYGIISCNPVPVSLTAGHTLRVNNVDCTVPAGATVLARLQGLAANITATAPNAIAVVSADGHITISVRNIKAAPVGNKLQVAPGSIGTAFADLGFSTFVFTQTIASPLPTEFAQFGYSVAIDDTANNLVVGSPAGSLYLPNTFDYNTVTELASTTFDGNGTTFFAPVVQSGVIYTYDYLPSSSTVIATNPGKFVFGQQVQTNLVKSLDQYGTAVSYNSGVLIATAPGHDFGDSTAAYGAALIFENPTRRLAWKPIHIQQPVVDVALLTSVYMYDRITSAKTEFFDFFDPLQGKILGVAQQNLDYTGSVDPAMYNAGPVNNQGMTWNTDHLGEMWWDISTVRFIDPNQDNVAYASQRWGQVFPGSRVDVYQWIYSSTPPANYPGPGTPYSINSYVIRSRLGQAGTFATEYYFWVRGITQTYSAQAKSLSAATVASYIQDPRGSGVSYVAAVNASTVAIYNGLQYINAADTILSIEFNQTTNDANVHAEYELIASGRPGAMVSDQLYLKIQDSFCGVDTSGNLVPDPKLGPSQRYGVQFRPRQSVFANRFLALKNYIQKVNAVLAQYLISENRSFSLLNSSEPEPTAIESYIAGTFVVGYAYTILFVGSTDFTAIGAASNQVGTTFVATGAGTGTGSANFTNWNLQVADLEILGYQDIYAVPLGYKYLVTANSLNRGLWTINTVETLATDPQLRILVLSRVQNYNTAAYWNYIDWYLPGYNSSTKVRYKVPNYASLATLPATVGASAQVVANAQGKFEIYLLTDLGWERVGVQNGTIEISAEIYNYALGRFGFDIEVFDAQYFDQEPVIETRKIFQAINEELLIDDLLIARNRALTLMFDFVLSEQAAPGWLIKTSLIDVDHRIRELVPFQNYVRDNQDFVSEYIQEVKPYHVQVREFNLQYNGQDTALGDFTDFDLPAYYDTDLPVSQYVSPILLPYALSAPQAFNTVSNVAANSTLWSQWPYDQWYNNYLLTLQTVTVTNHGEGYTIVPVVTIVAQAGDTGSGATARAVLNSLGQVNNIVVTDSGYGYRATPTVEFSEGNGTGARAYAVMNYNDDQKRYTGLTRSFKTVIKYDRYQYNSSVQTWTASGTYENGMLVRYDNRVWQATSADSSTAVVGPAFNLEDWILVPAAVLSGVNRTMGYYVPGVNDIGLVLGELIDGIDYPGVQVYGDYFLSSSTSKLFITCTATSSVTNQITCNETLRLIPGNPVRFYGNTFGGIDTVVTYYVALIIDDVHFTITAVPNGSAVILTTATGSMIAYTLEPLDAIYASSFTDQYLGLRPTDANVDGGKFVDVYQGHAPEELINGSVFDTLDLRVYTRPGSDWQMDGHGFHFEAVNYVYDPAASVSYSWTNVVEHPVELLVTNATTGVDLNCLFNYTVDWDTQTISILSGAIAGDVISIYVYEVGGGSQLFRSNYVGTNTGLNSVVIPVNAEEIYQLPVFENGVLSSTSQFEIICTGTAATTDQITGSTTQQLILGNPIVFTGNTFGGIGQNTIYYIKSIIDSTTFTVSITQNGAVETLTTASGSMTASSRTWTAYYPAADWNILDSYDLQDVVKNAGSYYRAIRPVVPGIEITDLLYWLLYVPTTQTLVEFDTTYGIDDGIALVALGISTPIDYSWSTPQTQCVVVNSDILATRTLTLTNSMQGTNSANLIVTRNGTRLRPAEGIEWFGDAVEVGFGLPQRGAYSQVLIDAYTDVLVWINNVLQVQNYGDVTGNYYVTNYTGTNDRQVVFFTAPAAGARILISVDTQADYQVVTGGADLVQIIGVMNLGDVFAVTTWNDTAQQNILTLVWQGPVTTGITLNEPYDSTGFDYPGVANDSTGSFDFALGIAIPDNSFDLQRVGVEASRLWVTLDGRRLTQGRDFTVDGQYLVLASGAIGSAQVVVATEFVQSQVPEAIEFRVFQDMRGIQSTYRITNGSTTTLSQSLSATADVIHVTAAANLSEPVLQNGFFGVVTIDNERIMYRNRDVALNTVSGLQRGTAGTAAASHAAAADVYDAGIGNRLAQQFQDYTVSDTVAGDGISVTFAAPNIGSLTLPDSTANTQSIEVYVGGIRARTGQLVTTISVEQSYTIASSGNTDWYAIGLASDKFPFPGTVFTATAVGTGTGIVGSAFTTHYYQVTNDSPVEVTFVVADDLPPPGDGQEVTILQRRGHWWYNVDTAVTRELALQETNTPAARFLRGL